MSFISELFKFLSVCPCPPLTYKPTGSYLLLSIATYCTIQLQYSFPGSELSFSNTVENVHVSSYWKEKTQTSSFQNFLLYYTKSKIRQQYTAVILREIYSCIIKLQDFLF
jgi:hypothetical protein